jgi:hypothetical protein
MSELDKTIEELEAEVKAELEEAAGAEAPKKGAAKGDSMEKVDGEVQDLGPAVVDPEAKTSGPSKADDKVKKDSSAPTKGAAAADKAEKVKEDTESEDGDELSEGRMTKAEMLQAVYSKMEGMKAGDLKAAYEKMMGDDEEDEDDEDEMDVSEETLEDRLATVDVSEDVAALTEGEELSEDFQSKAATIFEAAVKSKLRSEVARIESAKQQEVAEEVESVKTALVEKVDAYLNYVVEEWMSENELAVERGLKGEIAEDFISGLKTLFEEHYIDVPAEKYDILGAQAEKLDELEDKLNEQIEKNASLETTVYINKTQKHSKENNNVQRRTSSGEVAASSRTR